MSRELESQARTWLGDLVRDNASRGERVELEGLGSFTISSTGELEFHAESGNRVFIAYADPDRAEALHLYQCLEKAGYNPWMDKKKLLPGQNWPRSIEHAIGISDFFVPLFSRFSAAKRGHFHSELRYALDCARRMPLDDIFILPVRLEPCSIPNRISGETQYIDMYPSWETGIVRLVQTIEKQRRLRQERLAS
jgi:hypothetical protein